MIYSKYRVLSHLRMLLKMNLLNFLFLNLNFKVKKKNKVVDSRRYSEN